MKVAHDEYGPGIWLVLGDKLGDNAQVEIIVRELGWEAETRRLLEFCGLAFEEACVQFHEQERAVRTASSEQVRQPIYTDALSVWKQYESHLDPLKRVLVERGVL